jgi:hypothetical protein
MIEFLTPEMVSEVVGYIRRMGFKERAISGLPVQQKQISAA